MLELDDSLSQQNADTEPAEYDGGRDISSVVDAAAKATDPATTEAKPEGAPATPQTQADTQKAIARAWKAFRDDQELKDFDPTKMTAAEFLALKFGYTANGKEQRRDFDGLVRNAQQGHYNADKTVRLEQEREHAVRQWREYQEKHTALEAQRKVWTQAITAATRGNFEPLRVIVEEFQKALDGDEAPAQQIPEGYVSKQEIERQEAGTKVFNEVVLPQAEKLAQQYGFSKEQVATAIMKMVESYPHEFMDMNVLNNIMHVELPDMLTRLREEHPLPAPEVSAEAKKIAELEAKLQAMSQKQATTNNTAVAAAHQRREAAPPGIPTVSGGGEIETPNWEGAKDARAWLRDLK